MSTPFSTGPFRSVPLKVKKLDPRAKLPVRGSKKAAGYDLCCLDDALLELGSSIVLKTGLAVGIPPGTYGRVASRSGLSVRNDIEVGAGVVDEDFRGQVCIKLYNHSKKWDMKFNAGDRVAQLILEKIVTPEVEETEDLGETERGTAGFGSTGLGALSPVERASEAVPSISKEEQFEIDWKNNEVFKKISIK